ncbi:hypothetical protein FHS95_000090 [Sphingomonas naasensis]|nr:hypothetical protein [Sphingomonas naasensis]
MAARGAAGRVRRRRSHTFSARFRPMSGVPVAVETACEHRLTYSGNPRRVEGHVRGGECRHPRAPALRRRHCPSAAIDCAVLAARTSWRNSAR